MYSSYGSGHLMVLDILWFGTLSSLFNCRSCASLRGDSFNGSFGCSDGRGDLFFRMTLPP